MISKIIAEDLVAKVEKALSMAEKIVIVAHLNPDGDALGASLGMWHYLKDIRKKAQVVFPNSYPPFFSWMPGIDQTIIYDQAKEEADDIIASSDLIFALDFNQLKRLGKMADAISFSSAKKILVDHHLHPDKFTDITISYPEISSTSEMVFRLICRLGGFSDIHQNCAECIYTGMMTDTGAFTYNSDQAEIYVIIHELIKLGVKKDEIYRKVYNTYSENRMRLMGYCLSEKMKIYPEYRTSLITLTKKELKQFNYMQGDSEGFVNIPLSIANIDFSVFMREDGNTVKISLRSQGTFPANKVAADIFNGGGHLNAAGGESLRSLQKTIELFEKTLPDYKVFLEE